MKLYTEEMFLIAAEKCEVSMIDAKHIMQYIDEYVTPIEVPSDEEIEQEIKNEYPLTGHVGIDHRNYLRKVGYIQGAKMVINKIQGGNK